MTMAIEFTQYVRPHGEKRTVHIGRPFDVERKAQGIVESELTFECEVLTDGRVSLTVTNPQEGDVAIRVVSNGPAVPPAVDALVEEAHQQLVQRKA